jgi:hypothetical protein
MKKLFARITVALCAAAMLSGAAVLLPVNAAEVQQTRIMGDLNGDKKVTMADAKKVLDITVMSKIGLTDSKATPENDAADINMNGEIELMDAISIMRYFCQTLVGEQPLWSDIRKVSYHDGTDYDPSFTEREDNYVGLPFAKRGMYLEIGCAQGKPGETVTVPVYLAGVKGMAGFAYFQNTPERLQLVDIRSDLGMEKVDGVFVHKQFRAATGLNNYGCAGNLECGALVWTTPDGLDLEVTDGVVLAMYDYKIPEDAVPGETFVITVNSTQTALCDTELFDYQYTLLDGIVAVK